MEGKNCAEWQQRLVIDNFGKQAFSTGKLKWMNSTFGMSAYTVSWTLERIHYTALF